MTKLQIACLTAGVLVGVLATTSSASAQDAADLRGSSFGITPMIGAGLDTFFWDGTSAIADPRLSAFAFAGLRVRLDVGGEHPTEWVLIAAR